MKMTNTNTKTNTNLIALYQQAERLSNRELAGRLGSSIERACAVRDASKAPRRQLEALAEFEEITVAELVQLYGGLCA